MEILVFLGVLNVLVILAIVFWPKREPPDLDWKSCAMRREEEERRRREFREKALKTEEELIFHPDYSNLSINIWHSD